MTTCRAVASALAVLLLALVPHGQSRAGLALEPNGLHCLALTLYFEAGNQGREGMEAVAAVVLNRVQDPDFPATICAVVKEGGETAPCQFEWWCDGRSDLPRERVPWQMAREVAKEALIRSIEDPTGAALYFHANYITSAFHETRERTIQIGSHIFYR